MVSTKVVLLGFMLAASTAAHGQTADNGWRAANQAMGKAMEANDAKAAHRHGLEALRLYMKAGAPSEQTLVNLALNVADISLGSQAELETSIREIKKVLAHLEAKGPATAMNRLYLHNALITLGKHHGKWDQEVQNHYLAIVNTSQQAYGENHPAVAYAHIEYARFLQRMVTRGIATKNLEAAQKIADGLGPDNTNRPAILRMLAMYHMEGRRYAKAIEILEEALGYVSPGNEKQVETWRQVMGTLAAGYARRGEWQKADATVAQIISNTKENKEPIMLVSWTPDPLEDWNERTFVTRARAHFDIGPDGRALNIRGETLEGNPQYASYATEAMKKWRWVPVIRNGKPEPSTGHYMTFNSSREREARTGSRLP